MPTDVSRLAQRNLWREDGALAAHFAEDVAPGPQCFLRGANAGRDAVSTSLVLNL